MDKFLGMPIWPKRKSLSDSEYVEVVRRSLRRSKGLGKWLAVFSAAGWFASVYLVFRLVLLDIGGPPGANAFAAALASGFVVGVCLGWFSGHLLGSLAKAIGMAMLKEDRTSLLLVKYYDLLVEVLETQQTHSPRS